MCIKCLVIQSCHLATVTFLMETKQVALELVYNSLCLTVSWARKAKVTRCLESSPVLVSLGLSSSEFKMNCSPGNTVDSFTGDLKGTYKVLRYLMAGTLKHDESVSASIWVL